MVKKTNALLTFVVSLSLASPAWAADVLLFKSHASGRTGKTFLGLLRSELRQHNVRTVVRPPKFRGAGGPRFNAKLGSEARGAGAAAAVDLSVVRRRRSSSVSVVVASSEGELIYDGAARTRRRDERSKLKSLARAASRALELVLESAPSAPAAAYSEPSPGGQQSAEPAADPFSDPFASPGDSPFAPATSEAPTSSGGGEPVAEVSTRRKRRSSGGFHVAVRVGAGAHGFSDKLDSEVAGGSLDINLGMTLQVSGGIDLDINDSIEINAAFYRHSAVLTHGEKNITPDEIDMSAFGATVLGGMRFLGDPVAIAFKAGIGYDTLSSPKQEPILLVPGWKRMTLLVGPVFRFGGMQTEGVTAEVGLMAIPWGSHAEDQETSGESPKLLGGRGWLSVRYQLPGFFEGAGGFFVGGTADAEYLKVTYSGEGSRTALDGATRVTDVEEKRLGYSGVFEVGYLY